MIPRRFDPLSCSLKRVHADIFMLACALFKGQIFRRLERVFCCCSGCETMEDYKEGYMYLKPYYDQIFLP